MAWKAEIIICFSLLENNQICLADILNGALEMFGLYNNLPLAFLTFR